MSIGIVSGAYQVFRAVIVSSGDVHPRAFSAGPLENPLDASQVRSGCRVVIEISFSSVIATAIPSLIQLLIFVFFFFAMPRFLIPMTSTCEFDR